jgi:hypothetical protein
VVSGYVEWIIAHRGDFDLSLVAKSEDELSFLFVESFTAQPEAAALT